MKHWFHLLLIVFGVLILGQSVYALDKAQKDAMNQALTGKSGKASIQTSYLKGQKPKTTSSANAVSMISLAVRSIIAIIYLLFVGWLALSQYKAWANGDEEGDEAYGSFVFGSVLLLFIMLVIS